MSATAWLRIGAVRGLPGGRLRGFGAHGLRDRLKPLTGDSPEEAAAKLRRLENFETASRYNMYHALALMAVGLIAATGPQAPPSASRDGRSWSASHLLGEPLRLRTHRLRGGSVPSLRSGAAASWSAGSPWRLRPAAAVASPFPGLSRPCRRHSGTVEVARRGRAGIKAAWGPGVEQSTRPGRCRHSGDPNSAMHTYIVTVTAADRVGIVFSVAGTVRDQGGNILELSQTVMRGYFTIILAVEFAEPKDPRKLAAAITERGKRFDLTVAVIEQKAVPETPGPRRRAVHPDGAGGRSTPATSTGSPAAWPRTG